MNIVMVSGHACIRVQKQALPLLDKGHRVHLIANKLPSYIEYYHSFGRYEDLKQLIESVRIYSKTADIFHAHNEPSWFVTIIKENTDVPVVLDVHDSYLARITPKEEQDAIDNGKKAIRVTTEERNNFQLADALVFPSESFGELICSEFGLKQPKIILPSYLPRSLYRYDCREWIGGLVYEGRVDLDKEIAASPLRGGFKYCDYLEFAQQCHEAGVNFHLYTIRTDKEFLAAYDEISFVHEPVAFDKLVRNLTRHDWGLVGNIHKTAEWDVAFPNKLFEYIAACLPVVCINAIECSKFVDQYGIGITVKSIEELKQRWSEHEECRARLIKLRQEFTMEKHIHKLEELYGIVVSHHSTT